MEGEYDINGELGWQFESLMEFFSEEVAETLVKKTRLVHWSNARF